MCVCVFVCVRVLASNAKKHLEEGSEREQEEKAGVVWLLPSRGHLVPFSLSIPPLHVEPSSACSVASLSQSPGL